MVKLLQYSSGWREVASRLDSRQSSIIVAPRGFGKWSLLRETAAKYNERSRALPLVVSSRLPHRDGALDYQSLWESVRVQMHYKRRTPPPENRASFIAALGSALNEIQRDIIVFIGGCGRGHEENHYRVLSIFQQLLGTGKLTVVGTDDYSSYYYTKQNFLLSDLHSLLQVRILPMAVGEIASALRACTRRGGLSADYVVRIASRIHGVTGGHVGLAQEVINALELHGWPRLGPAWDRTVDDLRKRSVVLDTIGRALEEDTKGYCHTALEYRQASSPERNSPRIHVLRQWGVLQEQDPPLVQLCRGAITDLIEGLQRESKATRVGRVGTIVSEAGPRLFEEGPIRLTDDDLVIVHLSDLHVCEHYRYRLSWSGGQLNPNEQSAGELLRDDLESLGLLDRVDGLVISGDFVWGGTPQEFRRASAVVNELKQELKLDFSRIMLIPGNHDIEWNPGQLGSPSYGKAASRESYDDFIKLLRGSPAAEVESLVLTSRSGNVRLHIVGLDSNRVEGPDAAGIGFVARDGLNFAKKMIEEFRKVQQGDCQSLSWFVVHHHIFPATATPLNSAKSRTVSTMANSAEILDYANQLNVEVLLHGHEHQPSVTVARRWPVDVGAGFVPIAAIGAGSFGVNRDHLGPFSRNHYFILVRRRKGILVRSRQQGTGGMKFVGHSDMWLPREPVS